MSIPREIELVFFQRQSQVWLRGYRRSGSCHVNGLFLNLNKSVDVIIKPLNKMKKWPT